MRFKIKFKWYLFLYNIYFLILIVKFIIIKVLLLNFIVKFIILQQLQFTKLILSLVRLSYGVEFG